MCGRLPQSCTTARAHSLTRIRTRQATAAICAVTLGEDGGETETVLVPVGMRGRLIEANGLLVTHPEWIVERARTFFFFLCVLPLDWGRRWRE